MLLFCNEKVVLPPLVGFADEIFGDMHYFFNCLIVPPCFCRRENERAELE